MKSRKVKCLVLQQLDRLPSVSIHGRSGLPKQKWRSGLRGRIGTELGCVYGGRETGRNEACRNVNELNLYIKEYLERLEF